MINSFTVVASCKVLSKTLIFFAAKIIQSMYLPYFKIEILMSH